MKHKWKNVGNSGYPPSWPGEQKCTVCNERFTAPCDPLDSDGIVNFIQKQHRRNDCKGKN
jgi:hypothetical protein